MSTLPKYIKSFSLHTGLDSARDAIGLAEWPRPSVSLCKTNRHIHYDPWFKWGVVDLDLPNGTLWARMNVGSNNEREIGFYFAWGETRGYLLSQVGTVRKFTYDEYKWAESNYDDFTKYCNDAEHGYNGYVDNLVNLLDEDDAASWLSNGVYQMPTRAQWIELMSSTFCGFVDQNGTFTLAQFADDPQWPDLNAVSGQTTTLTITDPGYIFFPSTVTLATANAAIQDGQYMFLPAGGWGNETSPGQYIGGLDEWAFYYSNELYQSYCGNAYEFEGGATWAGIITNSYGRSCGENIRGVVKGSTNTQG